MTSDGIKVVFGTGGIGNQFYPDSWMAADYIERAFDVLLKHGVNALDTAQVYGDSEKYLGELKAGDKFVCFFAPKPPTSFMLVHWAHAARMSPSTRC